MIFSNAIPKAEEGQWTFLSSSFFKTKKPLNVSLVPAGKEPLPKSSGAFAVHSNLPVSFFSKALAEQTAPLLALWFVGHHCVQ